MLGIQTRVAAEGDADRLGLIRRAVEVRSKNIASAAADILIGSLAIAQNVNPALFPLSIALNQAMIVKNGVDAANVALPI